MKKFFLTNLYLLCTLAAMSQSQHLIKEVMVEGKAEKASIEDQKKAGPSTLVISSKDLNNLGHSTAGDVLKRLPRIVMQGPPSFYRNVMMAGLDKEFQALTINGERPGGGEDSRDFKLDRLPIALIEKIEITFNPPASAGADASIGLINIVLKDTPEEQVISAGIQLDNNSTHAGVNPQMNVAYGNKWNKWSLMSSYSFNHFNRTNLNTVSDTLYSGTENENLDVHIHGFNATLSFRPDSSQILKLNTFFTHYEEALDFYADIKHKSSGGLSLQEDIANDLKKRILQSYVLSHKKNWDKSELKSRLTFAQHMDVKDRYRNRENSLGREVSFEDEDQQNQEVIVRSDFTTKIKFGVSTHSLKAGLRASIIHRTFDRMAYTKLDGHKFWDEQEDGSYILDEYRLGFYLSDELTYKRWWISPALRYDFDRGTYSILFSGSNGKNIANNLNPSVHTKFNLFKQTFLKADIARQISRPPFNLLVPVDKIKNKKSQIERGNADLVPSKAVNIGLGAEHYFGEKSFVIIRGFYSQLRDVVETKELGIDDKYGYRIFQSINVDSGKVWGLDFSTRLSMYETYKHDLSFWGNATWLGSEVRDPGTGLLRKLNEQPEWILNGSLDYLNTALKLQCSLGVNYIGKRFISSTLDDGQFIQELNQSPFLQIDARIKYFFSSWGSVYLNTINMFNEKVELKQGAVTESEIIGRNIILGLSLNF